MADYIIGGILLVLVVLVLRSYFGKKFENSCDCTCSGCSKAKQCTFNKARKG